MKYFTQEQIDKLKDMEKHFRTVIKCQYKSGTTAKENDFICDIYEETTGEKLNRNWSCPICIFNVYKKIGTLYFDSINYLEKQKEDENNKYTESSASTVDKRSDARREALAKAREAKKTKKSLDKGN